MLKKDAIVNLFISKLRWIWRNELFQNIPHTALRYDVILNPSNPYKVSIKSTTKMINSKLEIDFENQL